MVSVSLSIYFYQINMLNIHKNVFVLFSSSNLLLVCLFFPSQLTYWELLPFLMESALLLIRERVFISHLLFFISSPSLISFRLLFQMGLFNNNDKQKVFSSQIPLEYLDVSFNQIAGFDGFKVRILLIFILFYFSLKLCTFKCLL